MKRRSAKGLLSDTRSQSPREQLIDEAVSHLLPIKVSSVFDTYWRFAAERQDVYFRRLAKQAEPWTNDPVISVHKFTNAYRAADRVSQYLIRHVIYRDDLPKSDAEILFRTLLFKLFNKIETWELLEHTFGAVTFKAYKFEHYDRLLVFNCVN